MIVAVVIYWIELIILYHLIRFESATTKSGCVCIFAGSIVLLLFTMVFISIYYEHIFF